MNIQDTVTAVLKKHPSITNVQLTGSRRKGTATKWSDWDFLVETTDFKAISSALPAIIKELKPLSCLWDPLAQHQIFMFMLKGPTKVDIIFDIMHEKEPPLPVNSENLVKLNNHFWDWVYWLAGKEKSGKWGTKKFPEELELLNQYLLIPLGYRGKVNTIEEAVKLFTDAFEMQKEKYKVEVNPALQREVTKGLKKMGYSL